MSHLVAALFALTCASDSAFAVEKTKTTMRVPIKQLIAEFTAKSQKVPNDGETHFYLGRLYSLVWAQSSDTVLVSKVNGLPFFDQTAPLLPKVTKKINSPQILQRAFFHFHHAKLGGYDAPAATLGMTWCTEQTGKKTSFVIENYRTVLKQASKPGSDGKVSPRHETIAAEARGRLLVLLNPKEDATEMAKLRKGIH